MNHFNFFENIRKEKKTINIPLIAMVLCVCAAVFLFGSYLVSKGKLNAAKEQLAYLESVEKNPTFVKQYQMEKELEKNLSKAESDYVFLRTADYLTENSSTVTDKLVKTVLGFFPKGTRVVKMTVSGREISIEGVAESMDAMIGIEKKMSASPNFSRVFIDTVKQDTHTDVNGKGAVTFNCKLTISQKGDGN